MNRFHVNPKTLNVGKCSAFVGECPFGIEDQHFTTQDDARKHAETMSSIPTTRPLRKTCSIFRVGSIEPTIPEQRFDDLNEMISDMDALKPDDRPGREGSIFASPNLKSHGRWIQSRDTAYESHELKVDPNEVYVYPVRIYEDASLAQSNGEQEKFEAIAKEYWDSGMTITEYNEWSQKHGKHLRGSWEIILTPEQIKKSQPVSNRRIIENVLDEDADAVNWKIEPNRARKDKIWRKPVK